MSKIELLKQTIDSIELKSPRSNTESQKILKQALVNKFALIFKMLDSDGDNLIGKDSIQTTELPAEIVKCLSPVLQEI